MKREKKVLVLNRETLCTLELATTRGGVEVLPIDYNLPPGSLGCPIVNEPVDPNERYRIPSIFR